MDHDEKVKIKICNAALAILGGNRIESLQEKTKEARACDTTFDRVLSEMLRRAEWNFALRKMDLALLRQDRNEMVYRVPKNCLKALRIIDPRNYKKGIVNFYLRGKEIYCEVEQAALEFICNDFSLSEMDSLFETALTYRLANEICIEITGDMNKSNQVFQRYALELENARLENAREGYEPALERNPYTEARN